MQKYVCGLLFSPDKKHIALIKKKRPIWQYGLYNAIGGKVEGCESVMDAMAREYKEESGIYIDKWEGFTYITGEDFEVYFFRSFSDEVFKAKTTTDEMVSVHHISKIMELDMVSNMKWIIPLALDTSKPSVTIRY